MTCASNSWSLKTRLVWSSLTQNSGFTHTHARTYTQTHTVTTHTYTRTRHTHMHRHNYNTQEQGTHTYTSNTHNTCTHTSTHAHTHTRTHTHTHTHSHTPRTHTHTPGLTILAAKLQSGVVLDPSYQIEGFVASIRHVETCFNCFSETKRKVHFYCDENSKMSY